MSEYLTIINSGKTLTQEEFKQKNSSSVMFNRGANTFTYFYAPQSETTVNIAENRVSYPDFLLLDK